MTFISMLQSTNAIAGPQAELCVAPRPRRRLRVALVATRVGAYRAVSSLRLP